MGATFLLLGLGQATMSFLKQLTSTPALSHTLAHLLAQTTQTLSLRSFTGGV